MADRSFSITSFSITSSSVGNGFSTLQSHIEQISATTDASHTQGIVATRYGLVDVEQWVYGTGSYDDTATFQIILNNCLFTSILHKSYSKRYLVTLASRFAEKCAGMAAGEKENHG